MTEARLVDLFAEDVGHSRFVTALARRLAMESGRPVRVRVRVARGSRVMDELVTAQRSAQSERPDLLVVVKDANCRGWDAVRKDVQGYVEPAYCPRQIVVCPDPHVERWYLADPHTLRASLGVNVVPPAQKCERDLYKQILLNGLKAAGHNVTLGGAEFADEIVAAMDLYRAGKNDASLKHCIDDLRAVLKELG